MDYLLQENGDKLLQETDDGILLEQQVAIDILANVISIETTLNIPVITSGSNIYPDVINIETTLNEATITSGINILANVINIETVLNNPIVTSGGINIFVDVISIETILNIPLIINNNENMEKFLTQSEINLLVQDEMAGQDPDDEMIARQMNAEINHLKTKYDLYSYSRTVVISITPGIPTLISSLVPNNDVQSIRYVRYTDEDKIMEGFTDTSAREVSTDFLEEKMQDEYSLYYEDGLQYLLVQTISQETTATEFTMKYLTIANALDETTFKRDVDNTTDGLKTLIDRRYQDVVVLGTVKRLLYPTIGDDGNTQVAIVGNRYKSAMSKLGLGTNSNQPKKTIRKIKLRRR